MDGPVLADKEDYQEKLFEILDPVLPHYSTGGAQLTLGYTGASYPPKTAGLEVFARVLWGACAVLLRRWYE